MPTPLSMAKAPAAAQPTQIRQATTQAAKPGAGGRQLSQTGVYGVTGKLPQVSASGGGPVTPAAMLPTPMPLPGSTKTAGLFDKLDDLTRKAVASHAKRRPYRSPADLLPPKPRVVEPPRGPTFDSVMTETYGPDVIKGPASVLPPPPGRFEHLKDMSDDDFFDAIT